MMEPSRNSVFDKEGLALALKHFTSTTLTMRLTGISQINIYISLFTEYSQQQNESNLSVKQLENLQEELTEWILSNQIIEHIFGPNLHVEVIKQSHVILNFVVSKITPEHVDAIWAAAQLKHCSKQVHDLLNHLVKNMDLKSVLHLYSLLCALDAKDHNENTLHLASSILKYIWARSLNIQDIGANLSNSPSSSNSVMPTAMKTMSTPLNDLASSIKSSIFTLLPARSQDGESSSASADASDEDDEDEFNVLGETAAEPFVKPGRSVSNTRPSPDSSSCWSSSDEIDPTVQATGASAVIKLKSHNESTEKMDESESEEEVYVGHLSPIKQSPVTALHKRPLPAIDDCYGLDHKSPLSLKRLKSKDLMGDGAHLITNEDSNSSRNSQTSQKRMSDFEGEDSCNEADLEDLISNAKDDSSSPDHRSSPIYSNSNQPLTPPSPSFKLRPSSKQHHHSSSPSMASSSHLSRFVSISLSDREGMGITRDPTLSQFSIENVCKPGQTLLWDLLQDGKINQLTDGLAHECEKVLFSLICWVNEKRVRMKFIEGCLENLEKNHSVIISLKLLPKLLMSFQQYRGSSDIHAVTLWAATEKSMLHHFFTNLLLYCSRGKESTTPEPSAGCGASSGSGGSFPSKAHRQHSHQEEIHIRLSFLSFIFSSTGSPDSFRLNREQVDILWNSIAGDKDSRDQLFSWMITQIRSRDQHALSPELYQYILVEKMPLVKPENFTMLALDILQCLCVVFLNNSSASGASSSSSSPNCPSDKSVIPVAVKLLWDIALTASNTDVSMTAIKHLNSYYIHAPTDDQWTLSKEEEFIQECMKYLKDSLTLFKTDEEKHSTVIQRALTLLKTHLEVFRMRYSFHLRRMQLEGDASVISHRTKVCERSCQQIIRIHCQAASSEEKTHFEMNASDYLGEFRAEATHWWESLTKKGKFEGNNYPSDGQLRLLSQGQELHMELDDKTLSDLGFKENQVVYISVGRTARRPRDSSIEPASILPAPLKKRMPTVILLNKHYFDQLFDLSQQLGEMTGPPHVRAQVLSRRVWDIIQMLPTSPDLLSRLQGIASTAEQENVCIQKNISLVLNDLISPNNPQKLVYCVHIVEWLRRTSVRKDGVWAQEFIECGGLQHIFDTFVSGILQANNSEETWSEWKQDCLATLLQLLYRFGTNAGKEVKMPDGSNVTKDVQDHPAGRKATKRNKKSGGTDGKSQVHTFNQGLLEMLKDTDAVLKVLFTILNEATSPPADINCYQTGFWGRAQIVHHTIVFLTSWVFSDPLVSKALFKFPNFATILRKLCLEDPDPAVRREACLGFNRLCGGYITQHNSKKGHAFVPPLLNILLQFIQVAENMGSPKLPSSSDEIAFLESESYGPGCKDYFWLVCKLLEHLEEEDKGTVDFERLCLTVTNAIIKREIREVRNTSAEDEALRGLLALMTAAFKHNPPFKFRQEGKDFLVKVFDALFALPDQDNHNLPLCKAYSTRASAFDLLIELCKENKINYETLVNLLQRQHVSSSHPPYPWDFWPHDDCRSECGYVGLINLGATCYMASCLQHLFMIPEARNAILSAKVAKDMKHEPILRELQRMFAFLLESQRKSYNPRSFCKVYTMDHELLNTGEQKDMTEFFTDLISKFEEMTDDLKGMVKSLFGGTLSNNVVSLDCPHISKTSEEFYTLRCKVADMRNLWDSLDDLTVKDTLEGDNMYTCSQCGKKVRAEKRACIKKLPKILCFNTMRYTFNMLTMTKEKVNTHFSFPLTLDMSPYLEENLIPGQSSSCDRDSSNEYELIGVTVHTGTAEGGHYYSFIRERERPKDRDKWYMFNDAEVDYFDPSQIGPECFGGEMTSKTYDSVTDKFMDFSFEKTNSAYMLFYERIQERSKDDSSGEIVNYESQSTSSTCKSVLAPDMASWIWEDNTQFLKDKTIFEHNYFEFLHIICSNTPTTISDLDPSTTLLTAKLAVSFVFETLIHSKEKPTLATWIDLLTKHFNHSIDACVWFLEYMSEDAHWPVQILLKCPNQIVRQLFQKLCIHVIGRLRSQEKDRYMNPLPDVKKDAVSSAEIDVLKHVGRYSCITRFIKKLLSLIKCNNFVKPNPKHLAEYFTLLFEFAKMGEEESRFLLVIEAINTVVHFYLNYCKSGSDFVEMMSDDEDDEEDELSTTIYRRSTHTSHLSLDEKSFKPFSLEKMVNFVAYLVENSRGSDDRLHLSANDQEILFGGKAFPFIQRQIRDSINLRQTMSLISSFCKYNEPGASLIVNMLLSSITRQPESSAPFFKVLSFLIESANESNGLLNFSNIIYPRIWEVAEQTPQPTLEWLTTHVAKNRTAHGMVLQALESWVPFFLIQHTNQRVRTAAAHLLVSLVPNNNFRHNYTKSPRLALVHLNNRQEPLDLSNEAISVIQRIFSVLLGLLKICKDHADSSTSGTSKLVSYFAVMSYCLVSKTQKQMLVPYFSDLWNLFQPKLSEPPVPINHNKQALLFFWYHACIDCPENVRCIVNNPAVVKDIAFNYILADHEDQEIILFNRTMLPSYYGLLRLCCLHSRAFTRQLAGHQNIQWAFKNITPYTTHYQQATNELFKLMKLFIEEHPDSTEGELAEIRQFKKQTLQMYLTSIDSRSNWTAITSAFNILVTTQEDKEFVVVNGGIMCLLQSFNTLFMMFHEATACHVTNEIVEVLRLVTDLLVTVKTSQSQEVREWSAMWKDQQDKIRKLIHLLNTYTPAPVRSACYHVLQELIQIYAKECIPALVQHLGLGHLAFQDQFINFSAGPYFPRRGQRVLQTKSSLRPPKAIFQMHFHQKMLETKFGSDFEYDKAVVDYFAPYHRFIVSVCKTAIKNGLVNQEVVGFCAMVALESLPMHLTIFPAFWIELLDEAEDDTGTFLESSDSSKQSKTSASLFIDLLCNSCTNFHVYILNILTQERTFLAFDVPFTFLSRLASRVKKTSLLPQINSVSSQLTTELISYDFASQGLKDFSSLLATLRALFIALSYEAEPKLSQETAQFIAELRNQIIGLIQSTPSTSGVSSVRTHSDESLEGTLCTKKRRLGDQEAPSEGTDTPVSSCQNESTLEVVSTSPLSVTVDDPSDPTTAAATTTAATTTTTTIATTTITTTTTTVTSNVQGKCTTGTSNVTKTTTASSAVSPAMSSSSSSSSSVSSSLSPVTQTCITEITEETLERCESCIAQILRDFLRAS